MIKRFPTSVTAQQANQIERITQAALQAADPRAAVRRAVSLAGERLEAAGQSLDLSGFRRIRLVGAGKAAQSMALGLLDVLGERVQAGLLITKHRSGAHEVLPKRVRVLLGGHPVPSAESVASARALVDFLRLEAPAAPHGEAHAAGPDITPVTASAIAAVPKQEDDLLFILISGGGSALMTLPVEGITLDDLQELTRQLLACGADIGEINTLRKHLDQVKGGGLARLAAPARVITLILSDVIGSPLDVIASGPTVADSTTYAQALEILRKYAIEDQVPAAVRRVLERGVRAEMPETLKAGSPVLARVANHVVASNPQAAEAALTEARVLGFHTQLLTTSLQGEAGDAGSRMALVLRGVAEEGQPLQRPACLVAGGETTVTLRGSGKGGRNQELALGAVAMLAGLPGVALVAFGTDGEDGPTDAAGAVVGGTTLQRAQALGLDPQAYLQNNDSYTFFSALDDLLITGPTGTNVNDLVLMFAF